MRTNWAGNVTYSNDGVLCPSSIEELQHFVEGNKRVKVAGTGHSFSKIGDTDGVQISLSQMPNEIIIDSANLCVTAPGHITYGHLAKVLQDAGFALHNLASLPHVSIAGAIATATHGSGVKNQNLAGPVIAIGMILADGTKINIDKTRDADMFYGAIVSLGALGVVTSVTLQILPTFDVRQSVFTGLHAIQLDANFDAIMSAAYSVSLFTDWTSTEIGQVWIKYRSDETLTFDPNVPYYGAMPSTRKMHPIPDVDPMNCTDQLGVPGPWLDRLPHFRLDFMPSAGSELQSEYLVPRKFAVAAMNSIRTISKQIAPLLLISEIRTVAQDRFWMSSAYDTDSVAFHFTWKDNSPAVWQFLPHLEEQLSAYNARPHWGKLFTTNRQQLEQLYPKLNDFRQLASKLDPFGKFKNAYLDNFL